MKLSDRLQIHKFTFILFLIGFLTGYFKYLALIFLIVVVHEIGHILIALHFKRKLTSVEILPFGGLIHFDGPISTPISEDLLIASGGVVFQLFFALILANLNDHIVLNPRYYEFLYSYNILILSFNILPIYPLDGYKISKLLAEMFLPFKTALNIVPLFSILVSGILLVTKFDVVKNNIFTSIFLIVMIQEEAASRNFILNRFYLERCLHKFSYPKKTIKRIEEMYKNKTNFIGKVHEADYLMRTLYR